MNKGTAIVGTVSGTSLSFGTEVIFNNGGNTTYIDAKFDPNTANKFVISYRDQANSAYGTSIVGTVSGTSVSFGTAVVFNSTGNTLHVKCDFEPNTAGKFVVVYRDHSNSSYGTSRVGAISGTSLSFGSEIVFNTATTNYIGIDFDPNNANTFVLAYSDGGATPVDSGTVQVGIISGTSISYSTKILYGSGAAGGYYNSISFDPNTAGKFVVDFFDEGNSAYPTAIVGTLSNALTIGSNYYVQSDGTVPTVSTSPAVNIGKAISATSLILKG